MQTLLPHQILYIPEILVQEINGLFVLIDPENANWIGVNEQGYRFLREISGKSLTAYLTQNPPFNAGDLERFIGALIRQDFISAVPWEAIPYPGRREYLAPDKLHEFWVITNYNCNLDCRHCYCVEQVQHNKKLLSFEALAAIMEEARALGTEIFYFTGGEPLMREDLPELLSLATRRAKAILFTNGTLIDESWAQKLSAFRERLIVQISIEGHQEEYNRLIRGPGALDKALEAIHFLLSRQIRVGVSSTPTKLTKDSVPPLTRLLTRLRVGGREVDYHHLIMLLDWGNVKNNGSEFKLTGEEFFRVLKGCMEAAREGKKLYGSHLKITNQKIFEACAANGPKKDLCGAGYSILGVDPEGFLKPCATAVNDPRFELGRLVDENGRYRPGTLEQLWRQGAAVERLRRFSIKDPVGKKTKDLRYFHGGGCWYNMADQTNPSFDQHSFAFTYEKVVRECILAAAVKGQTLPPPNDRPRLLTYQHRSRITCAGGQKIIDKSPRGQDLGYCICFA